MLAMSRHLSRRVLALGLLVAVLGVLGGRLVTSWMNDTARAESITQRNTTRAIPYIGVVIDEAGRSMENAIVIARWGDGTSRETSTDRFGRFVFMTDELPVVIDARVNDDRFLTGRRAIDATGDSFVVVATRDIIVSSAAQDNGAVAFDHGELIAYADATVSPTMLRGVASDRSAGDLVVRTGGTITVEDGSSLRLPGGALRLHANSVVIDGRIEVSGNVGGSVTIESNRISVTGSINASGLNGGGVVQLGGGWQGAGGFAPASEILIGNDASIDVSATFDGDGGTIVLWADPKNPAARVVVNGSLSARGGRMGGDGGRIPGSSTRATFRFLRMQTRISHLGRIPIRRHRHRLPPRSRPPPCRPLSSPETSRSVPREADR
jgi:hypothetical protein